MRWRVPRAPGKAPGIEQGALDREELPVERLERRPIRVAQSSVPAQIEASRGGSHLGGGAPDLGQHVNRPGVRVTDQLPLDIVSKLRDAPRVRFVVERHDVGVGEPERGKTQNCTSAT